jgi:Tol biopolymer transport system component
VDHAPGQPIEPNGTLSVSDLASGSHTLTLAGLSFNCQVDGTNPTTVDVVPEAVTPVPLTVTCSTLAPWRGVFLKLRRLVTPEYAVDLSDVFSVDPASGAITGLTHSPAFDIGPQLSPDHTKVVFDRDDDDTYWHMTVVGVDGTGLQELATGANIIGDHWPIWSPDGSRIAFVLWPNHLRVMNADGTGEAELYSFANPPLSWSPDGTYLATAGGPDPHHPQVYIVRVDGTGSARLTDGQGSALDVVWSPDGRRLAFTLRTTFDPTRGDYYDDVWITNADGSQQYPLTYSTPADAFAGARHPRWSPDGKRILFDSGTTFNTFDLYTIQPDGTGLVNLTNTPDLHEFDGEWSSDGTKILFTRDFMSDCGLTVPNAFMMNSDGSDVTNLSNNTLQCAW